MKTTMPKLLLVLSLVCGLALAGTPSFLQADEPREGISAEYASYEEEEEEDEDYDEEDEYDEEHEFEELEIETIHVELEQARLDMLYGSLELMQMAAKIAADDDAIKALAILSIKDSMEPDEAAGLLEEVVDRSESKVARRLARLQLAEVYAELDKPSSARKQLQALLFSE